MTEIKNIYQRKLAVMADVKNIIKNAEIKGKDGKVQYKAVNHDDVTEELRPLFRDHGICPEIDVTAVEINGNRVGMWVRVELVNADLPSERTVSNHYAHADDFGDKACGKALSMAVKNAYLKAFMLVTGDNEEVRAEKPPLFKNAAARNKFCKELIERLEATVTAELLDSEFIGEKETLTKMREGEEYDVLGYEEIAKRYKAHKEALKFIADQEALNGAGQ